jgi:hypothetical protein
MIAKVLLVLLMIGKIKKPFLYLIGKETREEQENKEKEVIEKFEDLTGENGFKFVAVLAIIIDFIIIFYILQSGGITL